MQHDKCQLPEIKIITGGENSIHEFARFYFYYNGLNSTYLPTKQ